MIQLALRSSIQAVPPFGAAEVGQDRRQRHRRDHQLEPGQEDTDPDDGEQHVRRAAVHAPSVGGRRRSRPGTGASMEAAPSRLEGWGSPCQPVPSRTRPSSGR